MRLLRAGQVNRLVDRRPGRRVYDEAVREALIVVWEANPVVEEGDGPLSRSRRCP